MRIDFVIPWVDPTDPKWIADRDNYCKGGDGASNAMAEERYRDWGLLRYFFRSVAANAPWVSTIHFLTYGHLPEWLDVSNPKLNIVKHDEYIPAEYLPTFNSNAIELNVNRIDDLAEHFVLFNDDFIILSKVKEDDFFHKGLPRLTAVLSPGHIARGDDFYVPFNNASVLSSHFVPRKCIARNPFKWFSPSYGKAVFRTLTMLPYPMFTGFLDLHVCSAFLKSTFNEVWDVEGDELAATSSHRFREPTDVSNWLIGYWQCAKGAFYPRPVSFGRAFCLNADFESMLDQAEVYICERKGKVVCLNDEIGRAHV